MLIKREKEVTLNEKKKKQIPKTSCKMKLTKRQNCYVQKKVNGTGTGVGKQGLTTKGDCGSF
jgi:hypothetical protein